MVDPSENRNWTFNVAIEGISQKNAMLLLQIMKLFAKIFRVDDIGGGYYPSPDEEKEEVEDEEEQSLFAKIFPN